jgi:hypothetical protein
MNRRSPLVKPLIDSGAGEELAPLTRHRNAQTTLNEETGFPLIPVVLHDRITIQSVRDAMQPEASQRSNPVADALLPVWNLGIEAA